MARETPAVPSSSPPHSGSLVDWSLALDIVGGDAVLLAEVLDAFLVEAPRQCRAIELAVKSGDAAGLHLAAHTLKSSLRYLGAKDSQELAFQLEEAGRSGGGSRAYRGREAIPGAPPAGDKDAGFGPDVERLTIELARRLERIMVEAAAEWRRLRGVSR
jgi:HPt (histidine-containing phosphotransfer) domain-containing protein